MRDAPVCCLLQFFCYYFYNCCSYFSTFNFFLRFWYLLLLLHICCLTFVDCIFIFFQYVLNKEPILRRKIRARKQPCNFFNMQLFLCKGTQEVKCHSDRGHVINSKQIISFTRRRMVTKRCRVLTCGEAKPKIKLRDSLITWSQEVTCQIENIKISSSTKLLTTMLGRVITYGDRKPPMESHDPLPTHSCEITWKIYNVISPLLQGT